MWNYWVFINVFQIICLLINNSLVWIYSQKWREPAPAYWGVTNRCNFSNFLLFLTLLPVSCFLPIPPPWMPNFPTWLQTLLLPNLLVPNVWIVSVLLRSFSQLFKIAEGWSSCIWKMRQDTVPPTTPPFWTSGGGEGMKATKIYILLQFIL